MGPRWLGEAVGLPGAIFTPPRAYASIARGPFPDESLGFAFGDESTIGDHNGRELSVVDEPIDCRDVAVGTASDFLGR